MRQYGDNTEPSDISDIERENIMLQEQLRRVEIERDILLDTTMLSSDRKLISDITMPKYTIFVKIGNEDIKKITIYNDSIFIDAKEFI